MLVVLCAASFFRFIKIYFNGNQKLKYEKCMEDNRNNLQYLKKPNHYLPIGILVRTFYSSSSLDSSANECVCVGIKMQNRDTAFVWRIIFKALCFVADKN